MTYMTQVLIIDDSIEAANGLAELMCVLGMSARPAYSAQDARSYLATALPNVILLDIGMPETDGFSFMRELREEMAITVPVVALTGYTDEESIAKALDVGFTKVIAKPIDMEYLRRTIISLTV